MKELKTIIVGIDFSASSPFVMRQAAHISNLHGSRVIAVHVLNSGALFHWASGEDKNDKHQSLVTQAEGRLLDLVQKEAPDAQVDCEVCVGRPAEELSQLVKQREASLLVIAANDMSKARLGSISSRCARTVDCDVLIARNWQSGDFKKIVVCTDFSIASGEVIEKAIELAEANNSTLEIVHVIYPPEKDYWGESIEDDGSDSLTYPERVRNRIKEKMVLSLAPYAARLEKIDHKPVILESTVASVALTYHIKDSGADLVVLGTRVHSKLASIFVGTNAERLLHDAPVSVLAARFQ